MNHKSFEEILREKMGVPPRSSPRENRGFADRGHRPHIPFQDWSELVSPRKTSSRTVGFKVYEQEKMESGTPPPAEETASASRPDTPSPSVPPEEIASWTFEQQLAIDQLIRMGAPLQLHSSYGDIKKAYRALVHQFHPDRHQHLSETEQRRLAENFRFVVEAFQLFEKAAA